MSNINKINNGKDKDVDIANGVGGLERTVIRQDPVAGPVNRLAKGDECYIFGSHFDIDSGERRGEPDHVGEHILLPFDRVDVLGAAMIGHTGRIIASLLGRVFGA